MKRKLILYVVLSFIVRCAAAIVIIPDSYVNEMVGDWYCSRNGYLLSISTSNDPTELSATLINYNTVDSNAVLEIDFTIMMDPENEHKWFSSDGTIIIERYYADEPKSLWINLREYNSLFNNDGGLYSFTFISDEMKRKVDELSNTDMFVGEWLDEKNGEKYRISYLPASKNIYGYGDYLVINNDGQIVLSMQDGNRLDRYADPEFDGYMYLVSPKRIEIRDKNDLMVRSLEKVIELEPSITINSEREDSDTPQDTGETDSYEISENDVVGTDYLSDELNQRETETHTKETENDEYQKNDNTADNRFSGEKNVKVIDGIYSFIDKYIGPDTFIGAVVIGIILAFVTASIKNKSRR